MRGPGLSIPLGAWPQIGGSYIIPYLGPDSLRDPLAMSLHGTDARARNRLILVCAGESTDEADDCLAGQRDGPLSHRGRLQAQALAQGLKSAIASCGSVAAIFCSRMKRAKETCQIICEEARLQAGGINDDLDVRYAAALNERNWGFLEGRPNSRLKDEYGSELMDVYRDSIRIPPPGGESLGAIITTRADPFLIGSVQPALNGSGSRCAIIVGHSDSLRAIQLALNGKRDPSSIRQAYMAHGEARIIVVDRKGGYVSRETVSIPVVPTRTAPQRQTSNDSQSSRASSVLATPPDLPELLPWSALKTQPSDNVKVVSPERTETPPLVRDAKKPIELVVVDKGKGKAVDQGFAYETPKVPVSAKPVPGSRFVEAITTEGEERVEAAGRRVTFKDTPQVAAASLYHDQPLSAAIRLAA